MRMVAAMVGIVMTCCSGVATAQDEVVGLKLGPTFASASVDAPSGSEGYKWKGGVSGGGFVVLPLGPRLGLQVEGLYAPKGSKLETGTDDVKSKLSLDYFEVPILVRVNGPASPDRSWHVFAGPYAAMRMNAKVEASSTIGSFNSGVREDISDQIALFDFGVIVGAGVDIGRRIVVDGRYSWGLKDADKDDETALKNRALTFLAGIRF